ncbi:MAG: inositol-1-monophosphatase [Pseudomonadota bacterium]|nr:inositol-1-monophosphatase [Pseudomonadota bacterium]
MHPTLTIAKRAAVGAGKLILRHLERLERVSISVKQRNDFVSDADLQAEQEIIRTLRRIYPSHGILAEESGLAADDDEYQWVIDPLDGTTNFLHGIPHFAVSIAFRHKGRLESGLVYDPLRQEMFTASRGNGAQLNDHRIRVKNAAALDGTLLGTGTPFRYPQHHQAYLAMLATLFDRCGDIRRSGCATLDLAYVAAGRLDGFWEIGLKEWDLAAGALLIQEAGGLVGDFAGGHEFLRSGNVVAGNPKVFKAMVQAIQPHLGPALAR